MALYTSAKKCGFNIIQNGIYKYRSTKQARIVCSKHESYRGKIELRQSRKYRAMNFMSLTGNEIWCTTATLPQSNLTKRILNWSKKFISPSYHLPSSAALFKHEQVLLFQTPKSYTTMGYLIMSTLTPKHNLTVVITSLIGLPKNNMIT